MRKKTWKIVAGVILAIAVAAAALLGFLTVREYRPKGVESVAPGDGTKELGAGSAFTILTYNTGYAGLSRNEDFFMDGGKKVRPDSKELVRKNLRGIADILQKEKADIYFLQEVDRDSKRSYYIDEKQEYENALGLSGMFACNFKCDFVPYPLPPIGKVKSGLVTITGLKTKEASRISLPESFKWPVKTCNLKRCILEARVPLENTDKELVLLNFHLEAYDSGEGKIAQTKMLADKLWEEYGKGNYVIAGGDFNQTFEGMDVYPIHNKENWVPGVMHKKDLPQGFSFAVSDNVPSCRLLNGPYSGNYEDSQVYVIDGFIVSDNIKVSQVKNIDVGFEFADHQPVRLEAVLK